MTAELKSYLFRDRQHISVCVCIYVCIYVYMYVCVCVLAYIESTIDVTLHVVQRNTNPSGFFYPPSLNG